MVMCKFSKNVYNGFDFDLVDFKYKLVLYI